MKRIIAFAAWCCICCAGAVWAQTPGQPGAPAAARPHFTAIKAGHLLDVDSCTVLDDQVILIRDKVYKSGGLAK